MLGQVLAGLNRTEDENLLVGIETADDAGVYKIAPDLALAQTLDFITPIVDDPYMFGQIAAANSISDIYAMGGKPITAMNIVCFPINKLDSEALGLILKGGQDKAIEAGVAVVGGHTVDDDQLKYGMSVTGLVHPEKIVRNSTAKLGDRLILTKPLGTGIISTAIKKRKASSEAEELICKSMTQLNKVAGEEMQNFEVHACTDITGFGLIGHGWEMAKGSSLGLKISASQIPIFEESLPLAKKGMLTRGDKSNREYAKGCYTIDASISKEMIHVLFDPQTSGGLLISISSDHAETFLKRLWERGVPAAQIIGEVVDKPGQVLVMP